MTKERLRGNYIKCAKFGTNVAGCVVFERVERMGIEVFEEGGGDAIPRLSKAGAKREPDRAKHQEKLRQETNVAKPQNLAQTGWLVTSRSLLIDFREAHRIFSNLLTAPSAPSKEASRHFSYRRVHPALERRGMATPKTTPQRHPSTTRPHHTPNTTPPKTPQHNTPNTTLPTQHKPLYEV